MTKSKSFPIIDIVKTIVLYSVIISTSYFLSLSIENMIGANLMFIIMPIVTCLFLLMVSDLVKYFISGQVAGSLKTFIKRMAWLIGLYLILESLSTRSFMIMLSRSFLIIGIACNIYATILPYIKGKSPIVLKTLIDIGLIVFLALNVFDMIGSLKLEILRIPIKPNIYLEINLKEILNIGFGMSIISSIVRILRGSKNLILRIFGGIFPNPIGSFFLGVILAFYFINMKPMLLQLSDQFHFIEIGEWLVFALIVGVAFLNLKDKISPKAQSLQLTEWKKHIQIVNINRDEKFDEVLSLINAFVFESRKEPLIIYLAYELAQRSIPRQDAEKVLAKLINYSEPQTNSLMFAWDVNYSLTQERSKRMKILNESLDLIGNLLSIKSMVKK